VTVPLIVSLTARVEIGNAALSSPARTVTLGGTVRGSVPVSGTTAPPAGALAVSITEPVTGFPPTTLGALSRIEASAAGDAVTVNVAD
jgi:hypothetical protein